MQPSHRLRRSEAEAARARHARSDLRARRRTILLDLAARYGALAAAADEAAAARKPGKAAQPERADASYYERLETGARWLASRAASEEERAEHLGMANRYARLRLETPAGRAR